jgi:tRNA(Arg) A34 adenosine deaminase TadA
MSLPQMVISLPAWLDRTLFDQDRIFSDDLERMRYVIALSGMNVKSGTGGPFAAAVFSAEGRLVAPGVNRVLSLNCSIAHAEIVALALAQKVLGRYDLSDGGRARYELVTATEPCAMCLGAIPWSGVGAVVCGARDEDARAAGFDEGAKPADWTEALRERGITVKRDVLRDEACAVLKRYQEAGGPVYNPVRYRLA